MENINLKVNDVTDCGMSPVVDSIDIDNCIFLLLCDFIEGHFAQTFRRLNQITSDSSAGLWESKAVRRSIF